MLLTTLPEREVAMLLRKANALEPDPALRVDFDAVRRELEAVRRQGYAVSMGTSMPGAAALATLIPVARDREPMTLSVGGPMREVRADRARLAAVLHAAVEPIRRAAGR
jgi:DNA-binding IclR family transcriptional regulator